MQSQSREKTDLTSEIVKVIKQKESVVRDTVDKKKCVIIYGLKGNRTYKSKERESTEDDGRETVQGEGNE